MDADTIEVSMNMEGHSVANSPAPRHAKLKDWLNHWAQWAELSLDALEVSYQGKAVDRCFWDLTFAELGCGCALVLDAGPLTQGLAKAAPAADIAKAGELGTSHVEHNLLLTQEAHCSAVSPSTPRRHVREVL